MIPSLPLSSETEQGALLQRKGGEKPQGEDHKPRS